jgi:hypothetical protein
MTWTKLSDDYSEESWTLSDAAYRLHTEMLNYSNRKLLDCAIPKDEMRLFAKRPEAIKELVSGGWCSEDGDKWRIEFQAGYQRTRAEVIKDRAVRAENGRKGGRPAKAPRQLGPTTGQLTGQLTGEQTGRDGIKGGQGLEGSTRNEVSADTSPPAADPIGDAVDVLIDGWTGEVTEQLRTQPAFEREHGHATSPPSDSTSNSGAYEWVLEGNRRVKQWVA